ncbi:hypothetical protein BDQ12DRAFT_682702 [Crucibulum laeve]|uniref:Uncharacterized protein n=1 Tax=Crucibulum laeve TaxID=68775 RepID=A0A5C3M144_9AGAR|nr:hypothetical protein BDQ12DRAFT_682702 [Crucibulum laeve]
MFLFYLYFQGNSVTKRVGRIKRVLCKCISFFELLFRNLFGVECSFNEVTMGLAILRNFGADCGDLDTHTGRRLQWDIQEGVD